MNTEVNTDNVALTQRLSSKTTKNYYTGGTIFLLYHLVKNFIAMHQIY